MEHIQDYKWVGLDRTRGPYILFGKGFCREKSPENWQGRGPWKPGLEHTSVLGLHQATEEIRLEPGKAITVCVSVWVSVQVCEKTYEYMSVWECMCVSAFENVRVYVSVWESLCVRMGECVCVTVGIWGCACGCMCECETIWVTVCVFVQSKEIAYLKPWVKALSRPLMRLPGFFTNNAPCYQLDCVGGTFPGAAAQLVLSAGTRQSACLEALSVITWASNLAALPLSFLVSRMWVPRTLPISRSGWEG